MLDSYTFMSLLFFSVLIIILIIIDSKFLIFWVDVSHKFIMVVSVFVCRNYPLNASTNLFGLIS